MFAGQSRGHYVKLFKRHHAIHLDLARDESSKVDHQRGTSVVRHCNQIGETVARPVFLKHLFFGDENDVTTEAFALANKVAAFEVGGEADDVEWASFGF